MIPKSSQRGGGQQLATHLLNEFSNESVDIYEVRGAIAGDLHGAFHEWRAMADGTKCQKYLFSLSINPYEKENGPLTREQYMEFIERTEQEFGLTDQPRAIVFHVKHGREHCHVVWSRIMADQMKAVQLSHDHNRLRGLAQQFAHDYGLALPLGMREDKGNDRFFNQEQYSNLYEKAAQDRTGVTKAEHMDNITDIWDRSDSATAFKAGLEEAGYALTRGDSTTYVIVDKDGENFNASRMIKYKNIKLAELCAFLEQANPNFKDQLEHAGSVIELRKAAAAAIESHVKEAFLKQAHALAQKLEKVQSERRTKLDEKYKEVKRRQKEEGAALKEIQKISGAAIRRARIGKQPAGLAAALYRVTGIRAAKRLLSFIKITKLRHSQADERAALKKRHKAEDNDYARQKRNMALIEKKERKEFDLRMKLLGREMAGSGKGDVGKTAEPRQLKNIKTGLFPPRDPGRGGKDK